MFPLPYPWHHRSFIIFFYDWILNLTPAVIWNTMHQSRILILTLAVIWNTMHQSRILILTPAVYKTSSKYPSDTQKINSVFLHYFQDRSQGCTIWVTAMECYATPIRGSNFYFFTDPYCACIVLNAGCALPTLGGRLK